MPRWLVGVVAVAALAGCSCQVNDGSEAVEPDTSRMCELMIQMRDGLRDEDLTVEELLTKPGETGVGLRAMVSLLAPDREDGGERFRPAIRYLSERWAAESLEGESTPAAPSKAVIENARELDRFLAQGGCT